MKNGRNCEETNIYRTEISINTAFQGGKRSSAIWALANHCGTKLRAKAQYGTVPTHSALKGGVGELGFVLGVRPLL